MDRNLHIPLKKSKTRNELIVMDSIHDMYIYVTDVLKSQLSVN